MVLGWYESTVVTGLGFNSNQELNMVGGRPKPNLDLANFIFTNIVKIGYCIQKIKVDNFV